MGSWSSSSPWARDRAVDARASMPASVLCCSSGSRSSRGDGGKHARGNLPPGSTLSRVLVLSEMSKALAAFALVLSVAAGARANGAFPDEFSIHFPPGAPNRIMVGANFGLVISEDSGATWRYACEPWVTLGSSAALSDVPVNFYQVTADGSAFLASS